MDSYKYYLQSPPYKTFECHCLEISKSPDRALDSLAQLRNANFKHHSSVQVAILNQPCLFMPNDRTIIKLFDSNGKKCIESHT